MITDPWGEVVAEAGDVETTIEAEIDSATVRSIREEYAFLPDTVEL
jgi:predicted amidohydrolase